MMQYQFHLLRASACSLVTSSLTAKPSWRRRGTQKAILDVCSNLLDALDRRRPGNPVPVPVDRSGAEEPCAFVLSVLHGASRVGCFPGLCDPVTPKCRVQGEERGYRKLCSLKPNTVAPHTPESKASHSLLKV